MATQEDSEVAHCLYIYVGKPRIVIATSADLHICAIMGTQILQTALLLIM